MILLDPGCILQKSSLSSSSSQFGEVIETPLMIPTITRPLSQSRFVICDSARNRFVNSRMLSSFLFFCLLLRLPSGTKTHRIIFAWLDDLVTIHTSFLFFSLQRGASCNVNQLFFVSLFVIWFLYKYLRSYGSISSEGLQCVSGA